MDWAIQDVVRSTGVTSRALRHYDAEDLLRPTRIGDNGTRHYNQAALVRLQRILLLREHGLSLPAIRDVLDRGGDPAVALRTHIDRLREEQTRIDRQIASIQRTLDSLEQKGDMTVTEMFDGFDHTEHREEVERRWGPEAYARSAQWWESMPAAARADVQQEVASLNAAWVAAAEAGEDPVGDTGQALAERHIAWLASIPGTPATNARERKAYILGLAAMYVGDPRFAANYGGEAGAAFVRDALEHYATTRL